MKVARSQDGRGLWLDDRLVAGRAVFLIAVRAGWVGWRVTWTGQVEAGRPGPEVGVPGEFPVGTRDLEILKCGATGAWVLGFVGCVVIQKVSTTYGVGRGAGACGGSTGW
jgi:hypothetical protein